MSDTPHTDGRGYIPGGTRVLNTSDGEPGTILNGVATGADGAWTAYEVETAHAIEVWPRSAFVLMSELAGHA